MSTREGTIDEAGDLTEEEEERVKVFDDGNGDDEEGDQDGGSDTGDGGGDDRQQDDGPTREGTIDEAGDLTEEEEDRVKVFDEGGGDGDGGGTSDGGDDGGGIDREQDDGRGGQTGDSGPSREGTIDEAGDLTEEEEDRVKVFDEGQSTGDGGGRNGETGDEPAPPTTEDQDIAVDPPPGISGLEDDPEAVAEIDEEYQFEDTSAQDFVEETTADLEEQGLERDEFGVFFDEEGGLRVEIAEGRIEARRRQELRERFASEHEEFGEGDVEVVETTTEEGEQVLQPQVREEAWVDWFDERIEERDITREDLVFEDGSPRLREGVQFQLEWDIVREIDESVPRDITHDEVVFGDDETRLKEGVQFQIEQDAVEEIDESIPDRDITRDEVFFGDDVTRVKEGVQFQIERQREEAREEAQADRRTAADVEAQIAEDLGVDPSAVSVSEEVVLEPGEPLQQQFQAELDPEVEADLLAERDPDVDREDIIVEDGQLFVRPEQERIFEEGSLLGQAEDVVAPEDSIEFQRESRPEQALELLGARYQQAVDTFEETVPETPTVLPGGVAGPQVVEGGEDVDVTSRFLRELDPFAITLVGTDVARMGVEDVRAERQASIEAAERLRSGEGGLTDVADLPGVLAPVTPSRVERRSEQFEHTIGFTAEAAERTRVGIQEDPARTAAGAIGLAAAFGVPLGVARAGRAARGVRRASRPADEPLPFRTDLPGERPVTLRAEDVDLRAAAMRGEGSPTPPPTTQLARETRAARRSEGPLPALEEIREAGGLPWWIRDVGKHIDDIEIESRVGAGLVPPRITRRSSRTTDPSVRLEQEVLEGSPRDLMSGEITGRALQQRRQLGGEFEGATDPLRTTGAGQRGPTFDPDAVEQPFFRRSSARRTPRDPMLAELLLPAELAAVGGLAGAQLRPRDPEGLELLELAGINTFEGELDRGSDLLRQRDIGAELARARERERLEAREGLDVRARERNRARELLDVRARTDIDTPPLVPRDPGRTFDPGDSGRPPDRRIGTGRPPRPPRPPRTPPGPPLVPDPEDEAVERAGFDVELGVDDPFGDGAIAAGWATETVVDFAGIDVSGRDVVVDEAEFGEFGFELEADEQEAFEETADLFSF